MQFTWRRLVEISFALLTLTALGIVDDREKRYCIIDLSGGEYASCYPVSYVDSPQCGFWSDDFKTTKMVMRKINPAKEWSEMCKVGETYPVCFVSWDDARGGRDAQQFKSVNRDSFAGRLSHLTGRRFDLPTKEQWEYVCRAGTKTRYNCGEDAPYNSMCLLGWSEERHSGMKPVGMRNPNRWGIYDMHGNMWEWCLDRYCDKSRQVLNDVVSHGEDTSSSILRVLRGGAYSKMAEDCDSCSRNQSPQSNEFGNDIGFRVVMRVEDDEDEEGWRGK